MAMTDFTIIGRSLAARLFSTVTTVLTVAVAVGLMLVLLSMRDAGKNAFERGGGNMHLFVSAPAADPMGAVLSGVFYSRLPRNYLMAPVVDELRKNFPLEWAVPVQQGDSYEGFPVLATSAEFFSRFTPTPSAGWTFAQGRPFEKDFEVVLGAQVARATGLKLGDGVYFTHGAPGSAAAEAGVVPHIHEEHRYTVVGILAPNGTSHDRALFSNLESSWIIHAQDRLEAAAHAGGGHDHDGDGKPDHSAEECEHGHAIAAAADVTPADRKITGVYLRVATRAGANASAILPVVFDALRKDPRFTVAQPKQEIDRLFAIVGNIDQILVAMAGVVMVSSGIAIMLALYNSMEQRRRQIAVLRVLGASRPRIFGLVVTESALLGILGALAGVALAAVGARLVAGVLKARLGLVVDPALPAQTIVLVAIGTIALAALAGVVPAVMAYRTSVARNLRPIG